MEISSDPEDLDALEPMPIGTRTSQSERWQPMPIDSSESSCIPARFKTPMKCCAAGGCLLLTIKGAALCRGTRGRGSWTCTVSPSRVRFCAAWCLWTSRPCKPHGENLYYCFLFELQGLLFIGVTRSKALSMRASNVATMNTTSIHMAIILCSRRPREKLSLHIHFCLLRALAQRPEGSSGGGREGLTATAQ